MLAIADAVNATDRTGNYAPALEAIRGRKWSGVYAIIDRKTRKVLYVGESHSGRLYDTITRHFRRWKLDPRDDAQGRRRGGTTYDRDRVAIAYLITSPEDAPGIQFAEIQRLKPRDNSADGCATYGDAGTGACGLPV